MTGMTVQEILDAVQQSLENRARHLTDRQLADFWVPFFETTAEMLAEAASDDD